MANKNIITTQAKAVLVEQMYYSPVAVVPSQNTSPIGTMYCFLSKVDPWTSDTDPPNPTSDQKYIKQTFKNMFAAKLIKTSDVSPVLNRIDWVTGVIYDYYRDDIDMSVKDSNGINVYNFYVKNKYDQVFKCLWNNNGSTSTVEPYFEPGSYNTNNIFQGNDGYKWKYIYTIDTGAKVKFMDEKWIPVPVGANTPNPLQTSAGSGSIDVINVTNGGSGYDTAIATISVTVTGDGTGATGVATVVGGVITDIVVPSGSAGSNYTYANVSITSAHGSGATAICPTSPIGGHGFDPISELGCEHVMVTCEFSGTENNVLPIDNDYHQIGIVVNPTTFQNVGLPANGEIYRTTTDFTVAAGFGAFIQDEIVYQGPSLAAATFTARVLSFNTSTNVLYLINTTGTPTNNGPVFGNTSGTTRTLLLYTTQNTGFVPFSGYMAIIENRSAIQRSSDGIEQFRFVLGY